MIAAHTHTNTQAQTNTPIQTLAYVESPLWVAHAATQRTYFLQALLSLGYRIIVLCPQNTQPDTQPDTHTNQHVHYHVLSNKITQLFAENVNKFVRDVDRLAHWRQTAAELKQAEAATGWHIDVAFLTFFEHWRLSLPQACLLNAHVFPYRWVGMYFSPEHLRPHTPIVPLKRLYWQLADAITYTSSRAVGVAVLDEGLIPAFARIAPKLSAVWLPEITEEKSQIYTEETRQDIEALRQKAQNRPIVLLAGFLQKRKGLLSFLRAVKHFAAQEHAAQEHIYFAIVGRWDRRELEATCTAEEVQEIATTFANPPENLHLRLENVEHPEEFNAYIQECSVLYLAYQHFYFSSGLLAKAAIFEKPVIATEGFCIGERVEKYRMGITIPNDKHPHHQAALHEALHKALHETPLQHKTLDTPQFARYRAENTIERLQEQFCALFADRSRWRSK